MCQRRGRAFRGVDVHVGDGHSAIVELTYLVIFVSLARISSNEHLKYI